ncbi:hypothetical protein ACFU6R_07860 [Streptomyces sp. NPDC057499]|uniref:BACON domain-containing protein n=1 Tax=Streptomyces sp. NPDC057499 TaxID=3346150 RepID=UPI00369F6084
MTSSGLEPPTHTTGAHRTRRSAPRLSAYAPSSPPASSPPPPPSPSSSSSPPAAPPHRPPARYEPHLDGLFTYCLSVLCDHDAATEALGGVLAIAERQDGRCPAGEEERKSWLYALARWMCMRKLTEQRQGRQAHRRGTGATAPGARTGRRMPRTLPPAPPNAPAPPEAEAAEAHRRELAQLAWPEAAGTTPEQREALELAVRHRLAPRAVASVLGLDPVAARELLAAAACEVERTRAALAVVETGNCPTVARLTGEHRVLLSAALRRELVRHVDDCPRCRRAAERAGAKGPWPGAAVAPAAALPVVAAPRRSAYVAMAHARRSRSGGPRFDRAGFPMDPKDHAARRDRLRAGVVTTTVVATVVAAPVIALWTAYRGAPQTGEGRGGATIAATESEARRDLGASDGRYENAGNARPRPGVRFEDGRVPDVSVEVTGSGPGRPGAGGLTVEARTSGGVTRIRLTASRGAPVAWSAHADASWVRLSRSSGTLAAGGSTTLRVLVDHRREPAGPWSVRIALAPSGPAVVVRGHGARPPVPAAPARPAGPAATARPPRPSTDPVPPTDPATGGPAPTPTPTPTPTKTPADPEPDPGGHSSASPDPSGSRTPADPAG